jgi:DnaK suppressor protein
MDTAIKKAMKQKLLEMKEQILRQLISESDEFQEIVDDMEPKDLADIAADDIDRRILEVLGSQEIRRLQLIDAALGRIENGHYGICMGCGKRFCASSASHRRNVATARRGKEPLIGPARSSDT